MVFVHKLVQATSFLIFSSAVALASPSIRGVRLYQAEKDVIKLLGTPTIRNKEHHLMIYKRHDGSRLFVKLGEKRNVIDVQAVLDSHGKFLKSDWVTLKLDDSTIHYGDKREFVESILGPSNSILPGPDYSFRRAYWKHKVAVDYVDDKVVKVTLASENI